MAFKTVDFKWTLLKLFKKHVSVAPAFTRNVSDIKLLKWYQLRSCCIIGPAPRFHFTLVRLFFIFIWCMECQ